MQRGGNNVRNGEARLRIGRQRASLAYETVQTPIAAIEQFSTHAVLSTSTLTNALIASSSHRLPPSSSSPGNPFCFINASDVGGGCSLSGCGNSNLVLVVSCSCWHKFKCVGSRIGVGCECRGGYVIGLASEFVIRVIYELYNERYVVDDVKEYGRRLLAGKE